MKLIDLFKHHGSNEFVKKIGELEIESKEQLEKVFISASNSLKKRTRTRQTANIPTLEQVSDYCAERNNGIDPSKFINHYQAIDWMRGKNRIKDWKACVRTWELRNKPVQTITNRNR